MQYIFYLNGDYEDLANMEVLSLFKAYDIEHSTDRLGPQVLLIESDPIPMALLSRLALTHRAMAYMGSVKPENGSFSRDPLTGLDLSGSFSLRIKKIEKDINSMMEEKRLSEKIIEASGLKVDLRQPENEFYGIYVGGLIHVGLTLFKIDAKSFESRKPQYRPYFHPSSIDPRVARALVNISEARCEVMDPFCGTGGILIEAGLMGLDVHGIDIEEKMVEGTKENLRHYGLRGVIRRADTSRLRPDRDYEAVITDVPYGKSTVVGGARDTLYERSFETIYHMCRSRAVIVVPSEHDFSKYGFVVEGKSVIRVHKSLERHIYKLSKKCLGPE